MNPGPISNEHNEVTTPQDQLVGIPNELTLEFAKTWIKERVSAKRLDHIAGVAKIAKDLSIKVGCNPYLAELAAWLHDAYKEVKAQQLVRLAEEEGLTVHPLEREWGHLLHGPVAAAMVKRELGLDNQEVLKAISEHTLGAVPMNKLSKVLFLADCLEEGRPKEYTEPIWAALDIDHQPNLDKAILVACDLNLKYIIEDGKPIHPRTILVRNFYLKQSSNEQFSK